MKLLSSACLGVRFQPGQKSGRSHGGQNDVSAIGYNDSPRLFAVGGVDQQTLSTGIVPETAYRSRLG